MRDLDIVMPYGLSDLTRRENNSMSMPRDSDSFDQRAQAGKQLRNSGSTGVGTEENTGMTHDPGNTGVVPTVKHFMAKFVQI
jgi:hypothetical protein